MTNSLLIKFSMVFSTSRLRPLFLCLVVFAQSLLLLDYNHVCICIREYWYHDCTVAEMQIIETKGQKTSNVKKKCFNVGSSVRVLMVFTALLVLLENILSQSIAFIFCTYSLLPALSFMTVMWPLKFLDDELSLRCQEINDIKKNNSMYKQPALWMENDTVTHTGQTL